MSTPPIFLMGYGTLYLTTQLCISDNCELLNVFDTARLLRSRVCETVRHTSVCLSICPIIWPPHAAAAGLLLLVLCAGDIDRLLHGRRSAGNAISVTLSTDV